MLITSFEEWYDDNFESEVEFKKRQAEIKSEPTSVRATPAQKKRVQNEEEDTAEKKDDPEREGVDADPDAMAYIRSRKSVHKLNAARKDMLKV